MGENPVFREPPLHAGEKGVDVQQTLAHEGALIEQVVVQIAHRPAIGVQPGNAGKQPGKDASCAAAQLRLHTGLQNPVALGDDAPLRIQHRGVQRVEHRARQLRECVHGQHGVAVQHHEKLRPRQRPCLAPAQLQLSPAASQIPGQRQNRPPFPLPSPVGALRFHQTGTAEKQEKPLPIA